MAKERFANQWSEMWWHVRKQFEKGEIALPPESEKLVQQLTSLRQSHQGGVIRVESRREYFERTGTEPSEAIAFAVATWAQHATLSVCSVCGGTAPPVVAIWDDEADKALPVCKQVLARDDRAAEGRREEAQRGDIVSAPARRASALTRTGCCLPLFAGRCRRMGESKHEDARSGSMFPCSRMRGLS